MKKIVTIIALTCVIAACNTQPTAPLVTIDTTAIKQKAILDEQVRVKAEKDSINAEADRRRSEKRYSERLEARNNGASETQPAPPAKKGWSAAAKGTVIGAGVGAIAGGIIGKNLGGAAIGAAAGGGAGYLIGRSKDRKTGRVVKQPVQ